MAATNEVGTEIKRIREKMGLNQIQFCALYNNIEPLKLRIHQSLLSRYEQGSTIPPADKYLKFKSLEK
jgi:transcriptional regulator with XRE-family HTH domain